MSSGLERMVDLDLWWTFAGLSKSMYLTDVILAYSLRGGTGTRHTQYKYIIREAAVAPSGRIT